MIRILTLCTLVLLILRAAWVARRPKTDAPTDGTVSIEMSVWGMPWENDLYTKIYIPEFERQNPGIKVRFHHFEDYGNKVKLSVNVDETEVLMPPSLSFASPAIVTEPGPSPAGQVTVFETPKLPNSGPRSWKDWRSWSASRSSRWAAN